MGAIAQLLSIVYGYIIMLLLMIMESLFFAAPLYCLYYVISNKFGLPSANYQDLVLILIIVKILKFSSFEAMSSMNKNNEYIDNKEEE